MDAIIAVYNAIRSQSIVTKEQRFRLYYWKILSLFLLLGWSLTKNDSTVSYLIALVIPIIVILFDVMIKSRSEAIKRDGKVLKGLEDAMAEDSMVDKNSFPERFYGAIRVNYGAAINRFLETLSQLIVSILAIICSYYIYDTAFKFPSSMISIIDASIIIVYSTIILFVLYKKTGSKLKEKIKLIKYYEIKSRIAKHVNYYMSTEFTITQYEIDQLIKEFEPLKDELNLDEKEEWFDILNNTGQVTGIEAPRWLCHLVGLKHLASHIALYFIAQGTVIFLLQVRNWTNSDSPGHLDISVGGHVKKGKTAIQTAWLEMEEEIGFDAQDLVKEKLKKINEYSASDSSGDWYHNNEWCEVFSAELKPGSISKLQFTDGEVVGMYLCPEPGLTTLLKQDKISIASALRNFIIHRKTTNKKSTRNSA